VPVPALVQREAMLKLVLATVVLAALSTAASAQGITAQQLNRSAQQGPQGGSQFQPLNPNAPQPSYQPPPPVSKSVQQQIDMRNSVNDPRKREQTILANPALLQQNRPR
jgi:hypothetical protein